VLRFRGRTSSGLHVAGTLLFCSQTPVIILSCFRYEHYDYSVLLIHFCLDKMSPSPYL
jgi:hypothetical protein